MSKPSASPPPTPWRVDVSEGVEVSHPLRSRHLDQPAVGALKGPVVVSGWVLGATRPVKRVVVTADDRSIAHVRVDLPRADIEKAVPELPHAATCGFRVLLPDGTLDGATELLIKAVVEGHTPVPMWRVGLGYAEQPLTDQDQGGEPRRGLLRRRRPRRRPQPGPTASPAQTDGRDDPAYPRVVAIISTYNEGDIIGPVLAHLERNGVASYLIDNDSTDDTVERARLWMGRGLLGIERMSAAPGGRASWRAILARKVELSRELGADWYLHHDADEIRESPWPGMSLCSAIKLVDRLGYNAVDFRVLNFPPVDDAFRPGDDPRAHFTRWEEAAEYDRLQRKCWKAGFSDLSLEDGGHDVRFEERRLFPLRFLLRHYPVRSQAHGTRKVLRERRDRFAQDELAMGWHRQYDHVRGIEHSFMKNPAALQPFDLERARLETALEDGRRQRESPTVTEQETVPVRGFLDNATPTVISGWAARDHEAGEPLAVEIWDGPRVIATVVADQRRDDLEAANVSDGHAGFALRTPHELLDGRPHWIWATAAGTALGRSPLVLSSAARPSVSPPAAQADSAPVA